MRKILIILLLIIFIPIFLFSQNNVIQVSEYNIYSNKISEDFKILQISDLHSKNFGKKQSKLIKKINEIKPDIIVFTGDSFDANRSTGQKDLEPTLNIVRQIKNNYPIYYITGNHEEANDDLWEKLKPQLENLNIKILDSKSIDLSNEITITGINDPGHYKKNNNKFNKILYNLSNKNNNDKFNILLSHRPSLIKEYNNTQFDLILSGHAHGGQWRLPFLLENGIYAPTEEFFPEYKNGLHKLKHANLIISRGLGNSRCPIRLFNYPELVVINIKSQ